MSVLTEQVTILTMLNKDNFNLIQLYSHKTQYDSHSRVQINRFL